MEGWLAKVVYFAASALAHRVVNNSMAACLCDGTAGGI